MLSLSSKKKNKIEAEFNFMFIKLIDKYEVNFNNQKYPIDKK